MYVVTAAVERSRVELNGGKPITSEEEGYKVKVDQGKRDTWEMRDVNQYCMGAE